MRAIIIQNAFPKVISTFRRIAVMRNVFAAFLALLLLAAGAFAQNTTVRPRVAPTPTPPTIVNDTTPNDPSPSGPPVLIGGSNRGTTAKPNATPPPDDNEVIKIQTNLVTMPVSVLDRDGRFISGLQKKDFKIFENGIEQKVDYFQSVEQPFTVIMMLDVSPSTQFRIEEIQQAAITFIDQLRPADRVMVIAFDEDVHVLSPVTNNRYQLGNAIRQSRFGDGTSLYEAVDYVIQQLRQIDGRKAVVLFTDGVDTTSRRASYQSTVRETEEIDSLFYTVRFDTSRDMNGGYGGYPGSNPYPRRRGGGVTMADILGSIITGGNVNVGRGGRGGSAAEYEKGKQYLQALAENSGGREFEADSISNADAAFAGIAEELRRQYSLGYYPESVGQIGDRKQIKIRVLRPDVVVRAKTSYIVGQTNRNIAGK
jgi:Ca-activated chloride channel homolog